MGTTTENLQAAFAGESQANRKYLAFAKKAETDGHAQIAKLFRAAAAAETVHALNHFKVLDGVKSTVENLEAAIEGEGYEFKTMYPEFIAEAEKDDNKAALRTFRGAMAVEQTHFNLYYEALNTLKAGQDLASAPIYICGICGHTAVGEAPDTCPVCKAAQKMFTEVA